jgi:hypothetical protein
VLREAEVVDMGLKEAEKTYAEVECLKKEEY